MSTLTTDPLLAVKERLADPKTFTTVLLAIILDQYGTEALEWSPETIYMELHDDFFVNLPPQHKEQIAVGINLLTSDDFYQRPSKFVQICNTLSGNALSPDFERADTHECAWGVTEARLLAPASKEQPFNAEIVHYIRTVMEEDGILKPPAILRFAMPDATATAETVNSLPTSDPDMFAVGYQNHEDRSREIEQMLSDNLRELLNQLHGLPQLSAAVLELIRNVQHGQQEQD